MSAACRRGRHRSVFAGVLAPAAPLSERSGTSVPPAQAYPARASTAPDESPGTLSAPEPPTLTVTPPHYLP
jgi:hypothetical protein